MTIKDLAISNHSTSRAVTKPPKPADIQPSMTVENVPANVVAGTPVTIVVNAFPGQTWTFVAGDNQWEDPPIVTYSSVTLTLDGSVISTATGFVSITFPHPGTHTLVATGTTTTGQVFTSAPVSVRVKAAAPPAFTLVSPTNTTTVGLGEGGATLNVQLTTTSDQYLPFTVNITVDGKTTTGQCTGTSFQAAIPLAPMPLGSRSITVSCADPDGQTTTATRTLTCTDIGLPHVSVSFPAPSANLVGDGTGAVTVPMTGTASDTQAGMVGGSATVAWALSAGGTRTTVTPQATGDFRNWTASVPLSGFGAHSIFVWATDAAGNVSAALQVPVNVISSYVPATLDDRLNQREYLASLLSFAQEQLTISTATPTPLDTATLVAALGQPIDRLSQPLSAAADQGNREVNELRVPIELLRAYIKAQGISTTITATLETNYRTAAYNSLLSSAGTSYQELRIARAADATDRQALADRLGISLSATRPDQLDQLVLDGTALTEPVLESMFGLADTTTGLDPLRAPAVPQFLTWQLSALALTWADQDQNPNPPRSFQVLADPDLVTAADVIATTAGDPVRSLLTARTSALTAFVTSLENARTAAANPAAALTAMQNLALPAGTDLAALETQSGQGIDISATLAAAGLTDSAFLFLRQLSRLAASGTVTAAEWTDTEAVLTQANKQRVLYPSWRSQESGFVLSPDFFVLQSATVPTVSQYRFDPQARADWQSVLRTRIAERQALTDANTDAVATAEQAALPLLRDALIDDVTVKLLHPAADDMSARFRVDMSASGALRTTRLEQALESVQSLLWAKRSGKLPSNHPAVSWVLTDFNNFTTAWRWMGDHASWQSAAMSFLFPERNMDPSLLVTGGSAEFGTLLGTLRTSASGSGTLSTADAKAMTDAYLHAAGQTFTYLDPTKYRSPQHQTDLRTVSAGITDKGVNREIFWAVPMLLAQQLQSIGDYQSALDWYWLVFPFDVGSGDPSLPTSIYSRIAAETPSRPDLTFPAHWTTALDPFALVDNRPVAPYTRATLLSIIRCLLDYGDAEFTRETDESIAHARALYVTAQDLLGAAALVAQQPTNQGEATLPIPDLAALTNRGQVQLAKIRQGRNIAGIPRPQGIGPVAVVQPTPYRFKVLLQRAQQLAGQAAQMEAGYLAALEKYDAGNLRVFDAQNSAELAVTQIGVAASKVTEAQDAVTAAQAQQDKATTMAATYAALIAAPPNQYEQNLLNEYSDARDIKDGISIADTTIGVLQAASHAASLWDAVTSFGVSNGFSAGVIGAQVVKGGLEVALNGVEAQEQANQLQAGIEQRQQDWQVQQTSALQDAIVAAAQVTVAGDQVTIAVGEQAVAQLQSDQAAATLTFLSNQFTNPDLYAWMSQTLGGVYRYFLQQATATARLAQSQLAFERAEQPRTLIRSDYWQTPAELTTAAAQQDRRGLTGAEQLIEDLSQLDEYAFDSDRRKLNLSQTFSLASLMPVEFLDFRRTGVLTFATPMSLFDADFPGHYLRLIKQVRTSLVALVPPDRGIRATLYSNGVSHVTTGSDSTFTDVVVRSDPGIVALTSPINATGVFDLDAQSDLLLPFEGSGVDTTWEFDLPPAANPFDYSSIVDLLVTIDYTALSDPGYRGQVVTSLNADRDRGADCVFSLVRDFPDQWYDLNNPADATQPRSVTISLRDVDFPIGIDQLTTSAIAVRLSSAGSLPDTVVTLQHNSVGGDATAVSGLAGTRRGAAAWVPIIGTSPVGDWQFTLPPAAGALLDAGQLDDVLLMISWTGQAPAWTS